MDETITDADREEWDQLRRALADSNIADTIADWARNPGAILQTFDRAIRDIDRQLADLPDTSPNRGPLEKRRERYLRAIDDLDDYILTAAATKTAGYPVDALTQTLTQALTAAEQDSGREIITRGTAANPEAIATYWLAADDMEQAGHKNRLLTNFDRRVMIISGALYDAGNRIITARQIYRILRPGKHPSADDLQRIDDAVQQLARTVITIDSRREYQHYNMVTYTRKNRQLLAADEKQATINGKQTDHAYIIRERPFMLDFATDHGQQITTVDISLLACPTSATESNLALQDYILTQIARARREHRQQISRKYGTILDACGLAGKDDRRRLPKRLDTILQYIRDCGYISGYQLGTKMQQDIGVIIVISVDKLPDNGGK